MLLFVRRLASQQVAHGRTSREGLSRCAASPGRPTGGRSAGQQQRRKARGKRAGPSVHGFPSSL